MLYLDVYTRIKMSGVKYTNVNSSYFYVGKLNFFCFLYFLVMCFLIALLKWISNYSNKIWISSLFIAIRVFELYIWKFWKIWGSFLQTEFEPESKVTLKQNVVVLFGVAKIIKLTKLTPLICILSYLMTLNPGMVEFFFFKSIIICKNPTWAPPFVVSLNKTVSFLVWPIFIF